MPGLRPGALVHLVQDRYGYALALGQALGQRGYATTLHVSAEHVPEHAEVILWTPTMVEAQDTEQAEQQAAQVAQVMARVDAQMAQRGGALGVVLCAGAFGLSEGQLAPTQAPTLALAALMEQATRAWPQAGVKLIDLDPQGLDEVQVARLVLDELERGGEQALISLDGSGARRARVMRPAPEAKGERGHLGPRDRLLLTHHRRAHELATLDALLERTRARVLWLEPAPSAEQRALAARHAGVSLLQVEPSDFGALFEVLHASRRQDGPLTGWIMGQGGADSVGAVMAATAGDALRVLVFMERVEPAQDAAGGSRWLWALEAERLLTIAYRERRRRGPGCTVRALRWRGEQEPSQEDVATLLEELCWPRGPAQLELELKA